MINIMLFGEGTDYDADHYEVFSVVLLLPPL
jgi:hypothetical protein